MARWALAAVAAVLAGAAAVVKVAGYEHWTWLAVSAAVVGLVAAIPAKLLMGQLERADKRRDDRRVEIAAAAVRVRVESITDPTVLGVHRALGSQPDGVPTYVPRDRHEDVVAALRPGGFVLVVGDSAAGKSRLAFEAIAQVLARHTLLHPEPAGLAVAVEEMAETRDAVLWLDDLERFLGALTPTAVTRLLGGDGHRRVIVATVRLQELNALDAESDRTQLEGRRRLLAMATRIRVERAFSPGELERARNRAQDSRIAEALEHVEDYGVAEYLAAGPQLLQRWEDGHAAGTHARGAALVAAAIDCRRAGYRSALPVALLNDLHERYLLPARQSRPEELEAAWTWATTPWRDTVALLELDSGAVTVFDYLVDHVQRTKPPDALPAEEVLRIAVAHADAADCTSVGTAAYEAGRLSLAHDAFVRATALHTATAGPDHLTTLISRNSVAMTLRRLDRLPEADQENRAVLEAFTRLLGAEHLYTLTSRNNLALVLIAQGRSAEAEQELRAVLAVQVRKWGPGHPNALGSRNNLAAALRGLGRFEEAVREHRAGWEECVRVLGAEDPYTLVARSNVALVLTDLGRLEEAEQEYLAVEAARVRVLGAGHPDTQTTRSRLAELREAIAEDRPPDPQ
ncbi:tetratricopeptide repeat protein [Actinokineospora sp. NBRC 105648]|uniref:tetratricopeptide repeat protein n=1 Tax=Actinokineospora sp. NBRC 105648 TaxID=3032206 RepID=UPI0024A543B0|nr:tetratricopeptide repeat protein [Actinokineospora sp. NBRC 105648]GLZ39530.1 hypothetical protein Acsp05_31540 [Actinokineospora sp. NBRC 105648]